MKKILGIILGLLLSTQAWAVGTVTLGTVEFYPSRTTPIMVVIPLTCTTDASAGTLPAFNITSTAVGLNYYTQGFRILDVFTVNDASAPPTTGQAITIVDSTGRHLIGSTVGDTITVGTGESTISYTTMDRASGQRAVIRQLTQSAVSSSMGNSKIFTTYIVLGK